SAHQNVAAVDAAGLEALAAALAPMVGLEPETALAHLVEFAAERPVRCPDIQNRVSVGATTLIRSAVAVALDQVGPVQLRTRVDARVPAQGSRGARADWQRMPLLGPDGAATSAD